MILTKARSDKKEWMDNLSLSGAQLRNTLDVLGMINDWLGGNRVTKKALNRVLKNDPDIKTLKILDLGCGHGAQLRYIIDYGRSKGIKITATGIDANQDCIDYAKQCSEAYPEIDYLKQDVFDTGKLQDDYDIIVATLFVHHLVDKEVETFLNAYHKKAAKALVINDLHRSKMAYVLFYLLGLFIKNEMIVHDGLVSILRGFKRKELVAFSNKIGGSYSLRWMWAFRYQWILYK